MHSYFFNKLFSLSLAPSSLVNAIFANDNDVVLDDDIDDDDDDDDDDDVIDDVIDDDVDVIDDIDEIKLIFLLVTVLYPFTAVNTMNNTTTTTTSTFIFIIISIIKSEINNTITI